MRIVLCLLIMVFSFSARSETTFEDVVCWFPLFKVYCNLGHALQRGDPRAEMKRAAEEYSRKYEVCKKELVPEGVPITSALVCGFAQADVAKARELLTTLPCQWNNELAEMGDVPRYIYINCMGTSAATERWLNAVDVQYREAFNACMEKNSRTECLRIVGYHPAEDPAYLTKDECERVIEKDRTYIEEEIHCELQSKGIFSPCYREAWDKAMDRCTAVNGRQFKIFSPHIN